MNYLKKLLNKIQPFGRKGQGMTEFALIIGLLALTLITVLGGFGNKLAQLFTSFGDKFRNMIT